MTTDRELMQQALDALEYVIQSVGGNAPESFDVWFQKTQVPAEALRARLAQPEPEPVAHSVVAGALFDFMGWLTSRKERIVLSSADNASPAVEVITEFAKRRGLSLNNANVQDWHTALPQREWQGLTDEEVKAAWSQLWYDLGNGKFAASDDPARHTTIMFAKEIEAKLKEKNA